MRILIDMDGTIADWSAKWDILTEPHRHLGITSAADQRSFNLYENLSEEARGIVNGVMDDPSFYGDLVPIPGAIEAIYEMVAAGHEVFFLSAPWITNETCASDKYRWIEKYVGPGWGRRLILSADKTLVIGDILFDDKPEITGALTPTWVQVAYGHPYNVDFPGHRMTDWSQWRTFVDAVQEKLN